MRKSENITKQVHQWPEAIESIPLAELGNAHGDFLLHTPSVSARQPPSDPILDKNAELVPLSVRLKTPTNLLSFSRKEQTQFL